MGLATASSTLSSQAFGSKNKHLVGQTLQKGNIVPLL